MKKNNIRNSIILIFVLFTIQVSAQDNKYLPKYNSGEIIKHSNYILSYAEEHEQAYWVAYELTKEETIKTAGRDNNFRVDPLIKSGSATLSDYKGAGFDRGHLAPAGDMSFSKEAMSESFFMSNMSPQNPSFNRGIWKKLEGQFHKWGEQYNCIHIATGAILKDGLATIGNNQVSIPDKYYKIALRENNGEVNVIGFVMPNEKSNSPLSKFAVSIDEIEKMTGIDFFSQLDDELENRIEGDVDLSNWELIDDSRSLSYSK